MKDNWKKYFSYSSSKDYLVLEKFSCLKIPVWYRFLQPILIIPFGVDIDPSHGKQIKKDFGVDVIYTTIFGHTVILAVVFPDDIKEET
jgi:hypothetical protein